MKIEVKKEFLSAKVKITLIWRGFLLNGAMWIGYGSTAKKAKRQAIKKMIYKPKNYLLL
ncbi:MAG: hypothetical protein ACLFUH_01795 [Bacteroidales bacterium]